MRNWGLRRRAVMRLKEMSFSGGAERGVGEEKKKARVRRRRRRAREGGCVGRERRSWSRSLGEEIWAKVVVVRARS